MAWKLLAKIKRNNIFRILFELKDVKSRINQSIQRLFSLRRFNDGAFKLFLKNDEMVYGRDGFIFFGRNRKTMTINRYLYFIFKTN